MITYLSKASSHIRQIVLEPKNEGMKPRKNAFQIEPWDHEDFQAEKGHLEDL